MARKKYNSGKKSRARRSENVSVAATGRAEQNHLTDTKQSALELKNTSDQQCAGRPVFEESEKEEQDISKFITDEEDLKVSQIMSQTEEQLASQIKSQIEDEETEQRTSQIKNQIEDVEAEQRISQMKNQVEDEETNQRAGRNRSQIEDVETEQRTSLYKNQVEDEETNQRANRNRSQIEDGEAEQRTSHKKSQIRGQKNIFAKTEDSMTEAVLSQEAQDSKLDLTQKKPKRNKQYGSQKSLTMKATAMRACKRDEKRLTDEEAARQHEERYKLVSESAVGGNRRKQVAHKTVEKKISGSLFNKEATSGLTSKGKKSDKSGMTQTGPILGETTNEELDRRYKASKSRTHGYVWKRVAIYIGVALWILTVARILTNAGMGNGNDSSAVSGQQIVTAFSNASFMDMEASIDSFGDYGTVYLNQNTKETILSHMAEKIGITNYTIESAKEDDKTTTTLTQNGVNGDVICKIVTVETVLENDVVQAKQYIYVNVVLHNNVQSAFTYEKVVKDIMSSLGINTRVTVNLKGDVDGQLDMAGKNALSDTIMKSLDAKVITQNKDDEIYTIYGYTKKIDDYITVSASKINVNVTMNYDETTDKTKIYVCTPVNNEEY